MKMDDIARTIPPFNKLKNEIRERGDDLLVDSWKQSKENYEESKKSLAMYLDNVGKNRTRKQNG